MWRSKRKQREMMDRRLRSVLSLEVSKGMISVHEAKLILILAGPPPLTRWEVVKRAIKNWFGW